MRTNRELSLAVKRALATGTIALLGAGGTAAYAQPAATVQAAMTGVTTTKAATTKPSAAKTATAKATAKKAPIVLAQANTAQATTQQTTGSPANTNAPQLQTVVVTGSLIARTDLETPNPVQVLSTKDLVQSGYTDISNVLRSISANGANTLSQSFSFAFAAGGAGISLRGLTLGDTLVLIDGERTVPYPLLDDNQRSFVDVSSIPFMAVQQVQVDKNGASAIYGSDAIAGVVNVILRKEFQGFKASAEAGTSQRGDGTTEHLGFIGGIGSLADNGYNWYISGEFRHQDQILASHRNGLWDTLDWTPWEGTYGAATNIGASPASNPIFAYPQSTTGYLIDPATGNIVSYLPGCDAQSQAMNRCLAIYPGSQLQPATTRFNLISKFTKQLAGDWQLGIQASWFNSSSQEVTGYSPGVGNVGGVSNIVFGPGVPVSVIPASSLITPNIITIPATNPMYPTAMCPTNSAGAYVAGDPSWCGAGLAFQYAFPELGPAAILTNTNTYRLLANIDGNAGGWTIHGTAGAMYARMSYKVTGQINWQDLQTALNNGYVFGSGGATHLFAPVMETTPWSELDLIDLHGTHSLFQLPGGPLDLAVGVQYYKKVQDEHAPDAAVSGAQSEAGGPIYVIGTEKDAAGFVELDGKPIKQLEIDAAARYDNYQTFGGATTPQIGVKFTPIKMIALRGTWGKGFRAPSAAEGGASGELFGAGNYTDPVLCPTPVPNGLQAGPGDFANFCSFPVTGVLTANPKLQNVKSTNWTAGVIFQPISAASVSVDYYNVKVTNDVISGFEAGGLGNYSGILRGAPLVQPTYCDPTAHPGGCTAADLTTATTPVGTILALSYPYVNAGATHTSGFDVDLKAHYDAGRFGRITAEATWTHELTYQLTFAGQTYELAGTHGPSGISGDTGNPKDRANLQVSWQKGPLTIAPSLLFIGHFASYDPSAGEAGCGDALSFFGRILGPVDSTTQGFCTVGTFLETNVYGAYQLSDNFQVHASVTNLFNTTPPVDVTTYGSGTNFYPYDAALHQDGAVGRYFTLGFDYQF